MKTITVVVPTYNEEDNIDLIHQRVAAVFARELSHYTMELLFIDNCSVDHTRAKIRALAQQDPRVKAIFNARNFGFDRSVFYGLTQARGDCAVLLFADLQDPPERIPDFVKTWESGKQVVVGIKEKSKENPVVYFFRQCYYSLLAKIAEVDHIQQYDGFGLYDASFIRVLSELHDPLPYLRGIVAELGYNVGYVHYTQEQRKFGQSKFNLYKLYDLAMLGITSYSKAVLRLATFIGIAVAGLSLVIALITFFIKIFNWNSYPMGNAAIIIGVFFLGAMQLFFIGLLGEYVLNINTRVLHRPLVIEESRVNFGDSLKSAANSQPAPEEPAEPEHSARVE